MEEDAATHPRQSHPGQDPRLARRGPRGRGTPAMSLWWFGLATHCGDTLRAANNSPDGESLQSRRMKRGSKGGGVW